MKSLGLIILFLFALIFLVSLAAMGGWFENSVISTEAAEIGMVIGFLGVFILPIFVFLSTAFKDAYKTFNSHKLGTITFQDWLYNLIPFSPIKSLIKQVYPEDQFISSRICFEVNPLPVFLIETNNNFYMDRRLQNFLNKIIIMVVLYFFGVALLSSFTGITDLSLITTIVNTILVVMIPVTLFHLIWQVNNIEVVKKSWLTSAVTSGHVIFLYGKSRTAKLTLSTDKFANSQGSISLPFKKTLLAL